ncbi:MAG: histidine kinase dimerization/phospho-acceptor domain-containing protein [Nitrospirota bacterium]|nr:histidine kinase dimerization/phospho-acceptor domain-containing protein [Nitrospirota bacterium]
MGELALGIAHEVRNPLGIIKASAQLIQSKGELEPSLARLMGQLIEQVDRIEALLSNFLRFGRPSADYTSPQNLDTPLKWIDPPHPT